MYVFNGGQIADDMTDLEVQVALWTLAFYGVKIEAVDEHDAMAHALLAVLAFRERRASNERSAARRAEARRSESQLEQRVSMHMARAR